MDYAELAKRLDAVAKMMLEKRIAGWGDVTDGAIAIEALTSPPDEAQVEAAVQATWGATGLTASATGAMRYEVRAALNAAYRVRVKNEAKA